MRTNHPNHPRRGRAAAVSLLSAGLIVGAVLVGTGVLGLGAAGAADSARRAPRSTHIGIPVGDIVTLELVDETTTPKFVQLKDDATRDTTEFVVPEGKALVVTDFDVTGKWVSLGDYVTFRLWRKETSSGNHLVVLARHMDVVDAGGSGNGSFTAGGSNESLTSGLVYPAGSALEADVVNTKIVDRTTLAAFSEFGEYRILVRGYMTSAD